MCGIETQMSPRVIVPMYAARMETMANLCINDKADIEVQTTLKRNIWRKVSKDVRSGPNLSDVKVELTHSIRMEIQEEKSE